MIRRSGRFYLILLIFISTVLFYTLSLITTNGVLKPILTLRTSNNGLSSSPVNSPLIQPNSHSHVSGSQSTSEPETEHVNVNSVVQNHDDKRISPIKTLFRGDIPSRLSAVPAGSSISAADNVLFPEQNRLRLHTNGHQSSDGEGGIPVVVHSAGSDLSRVNHYGHYAGGPVPVRPEVKIPYKLVHIDLKGAPPKLSYLKTLFRTIRAAGGNGILLEYEDMFPFHGPLNGTTHAFHFNEGELGELISAAAENGLEVIPLVQTFGHLEFILKLEKFRPLREQDEFPQEICPSNESAFKLITNIIDQVLDLHSRHGGLPRYIHIGCDEVYHIGECSRCKTQDVKNLFLDHVIRVSKYVKTKHGLTPIIWDDMLRKFYAEELMKSDIGSHVELMMWDYTEDVDRLLSPYLWPMYGQVFPNIWAASAFKGAFGETLYKVDIQRHALNHLSWLNVLSREEKNIRNFRGVALTGWSRYDHFSVLCELLPVAVPSLILSLQILVHQNLEQASKSMFKFLKCDGGPDRSLNKLEDCVWDGSDLASALGTLQFYQEQSASLIRTHRMDKGWLTAYNVAHNYSSPWRLAEPVQTATQYVMSLQNFESSLRRTLKKYFEDHVADEWIEQKVGSSLHDLQSLIKDANSLAARRSWPPRPIHLK